MSPEQSINESSSVTIECVVRANPYRVDRLVTWYYVGDPEVEVLSTIRTEVVASVVTSRLYINYATSRNVGLYRCVAYNGIGVRVNATSKIVLRRTHTCLFTFLTLQQQ